MREDTSFAVECRQNGHDVTPGGLKIHVHPNTKRLDECTRQRVREKSLVKGDCIDFSKLAHIAIHLIERAGEVTSFVVARLRWRQTLEGVENVQTYSEFVTGKTETRRAVPLKTAKFQKASTQS